MPKNKNIFSGAAKCRAKKLPVPFQAQPFRRLQDLHLPNEKQKTPGIINLLQISGPYLSDL
jgi:hypothetical protein